MHAVPVELDFVQPTLDRPEPRRRARSAAGGSIGVNRTDRLATVELPDGACQEWTVAPTRALDRVRRHAY
jgi:hypothetical protein